MRWIESRHRAAPGYDWHAIEAENLRASLALIEERDGAKQDAEKARAAGPLYLMSRGQLFVSRDQGGSFSPLGQAASNLQGYAVLRGSEAGAPTLYAALGKKTGETLYVSEDGGLTWESRFQLTGTSYYSLDVRFAGGLAASIRDPNLILFGNADAFRSTDGGRTFERVNHWYDYYDSPSNRLHAESTGFSSLSTTARRSCSSARTAAPTCRPTAASTWGTSRRPACRAGSSTAPGAAPPTGPLPRRLAGPGPSAFGPRQGRRGPEQRAIGSAAPALYAATETGPFVLDGSTWRSLLGGGAPAGRYLSVEGVPSAKLVRFGTYSRGVWDYVPPPRR